MAQRTDRQVPAISLEGVGKRFGQTTALADIDLEVPDGEFISLLGPSGCGKSTTLRLIAGLDMPSEGRVLFGGKDATHLGPSARNVAMVFQSYALYPHLTVGENIALPLAMARLTRIERLPGVSRLWPSARRKIAANDQAVLAAAQMLGIASLLDRKPSQLSGGQKQRVALARALVREPSVFLLDEPLSNLDAKLRVTTREELTELHARTARPFVYVTHDQAEAMAMSDRIAVFRDGRIVQTGAPTDIYEAPADSWVAGFVGDHPISLIDTHVEPGGWLAPPFNALATDAAAGPLTVGLRPEVLSPASPVDAHITVSVRKVAYLGAEALVSGVLGGLADARDTPSVRVALPAGTPRPQVGTAMTLRADLSRVLLFGPDGNALQAHLGERGPGRSAEPVGVRGGRG